MSQEIITKSFDLIDAECSDGEVVAYLTSFKNEDLVGDIINPGALDRFVASFDPQAKKLPMLLNHDRSAIIGEWNALEIDDFGVKGKGILYTETTMGKDVQALLKRKAIKSASIGFYSTDYKKLSNGAREFDDIELIETSIVLFPANPKAQVISVKSADGLIETKALKVVLGEAGLTRSEIEALFQFGWKGLVNLRNTEAETDSIVTALKNFKL